MMHLHIVQNIDDVIQIILLVSFVLFNEEQKIIIVKMI